ncbi:hypothetical protein [Streptacidiphilus anmyonensis]|uniref:hypothetical protein n=1 Tax=Streptacidiphilus anmyonensis TaxID=405782 RepID=UPI0005AB90F2|nr:hypothetical protein [Streptacidiphilus anmyonensis]
MNSPWDCGACGTPEDTRASCLVCGTSSPTATPDSLAATALEDAYAAHRARTEEAARGNHDLAAHLGRVADACLDDALAMRQLGNSTPDPL